MRFIPLDDNISYGHLRAEQRAERLAAWWTTRATQINASRNQQDFTVRLNFDQPLAKGQPVTMTFTYDGHLTGRRIRRSTASSSPPSITITPSCCIRRAGFRSAATPPTASRPTCTSPSPPAIACSAAASIPTSRRRQDALQLSFRPPLVSRQHRGGEGSPEPRYPPRASPPPLYFRGDEKADGAAVRRADRQDHDLLHRPFGLPPYANLTVVETEAARPTAMPRPECSSWLRAPSASR